MLQIRGYGYRRVSLALGINRKRIQRVMQKFHLNPLRRAKTPNKDADFDKPSRKVPDILYRLCPCVPNEVSSLRFYVYSVSGAIHLSCKVTGAPRASFLLL